MPKKHKNKKERLAYFQKWRDEHREELTKYNREYKQKQRKQKNEQLEETIKR